MSAEAPQATESPVVSSTPVDTPRVAPTADTTALDVSSVHHSQEDSVVSGTSQLMQQAPSAVATPLQESGSNGGASPPPVPAPVSQEQSVVLTADASGVETANVSHPSVSTTSGSSSVLPNVSSASGSNPTPPEMSVGHEPPSFTEHPSDVQERPAPSPEMIQLGNTSHPEAHDTTLAPPTATPPAVPLNSTATNMARMPPSPPPLHTAGSGSVSSPPRSPSVRSDRSDSSDRSSRRDKKREKKEKKKRRSSSHDRRHDEDKENAAVPTKKKAAFKAPVTPLERDDLDGGPILSEAEPEAQPSRHGAKNTAAAGRSLNVPNLGENMMLVHVQSSSPLTPNPSIVHPYLRVFYVDGTNGDLLTPETARTQYADTYPYDFHERQSSSPKWDDHLRLPISPNAAACEHGTLLIEMLDFGEDTVGYSQNVENVGFFPICWGFIRIKDYYGRSNAGKPLNVQMFRYPERWNCMMRSCLGCIPSFLGSDAVEAPSGMMTPGIKPRVYRIFQDPNNRKLHYPASVCLSFSFDAKEIMAAPPMHHGVTNWERRLRSFVDRGDETLGLAASSVGEDLLKKSHVGASGEEARDRDASKNALKNYMRKRSERSLPPTTTLHDVSIPHATITAMTFSPDGAWLAVATSTDFTSSISIFDVFDPKMTRIALLLGHLGHIHKLTFSKDLRRIMSCSSDSTIRVWNFPRDIDEHGQLLPPTNMPITDQVGSDNACILLGVHPFPVYSAVFHHEYVVTGGYDSNLHVWHVDTQSVARVVPLGNPAFTKDIVTDTDENKIWTIDSSGAFLMWRAVRDNESGVQLSVRQRTSIRGAASIQIVTSGAEGYAVLPCPEDGAVAVVELSTFTFLRNIQVPSQELSSVALLSDSKVFVTGRVNGRLSAWEVTSGTPYTPSDGTDKAKIGFEIDKIVWNPKNHIAAVCSHNRSDPVHGQVHGNAGTETNGGEVHLKIVGHPRPHDQEVVLDSDSKAGDVVRALFGGTVKVFGSSGAGSPMSSTRDRSAKNRRTPSNPFTSVLGSSPTSASTRPPIGDAEDPTESKWQMMINHWAGIVDKRRKKNEERAKE